MVNVAELFCTLTEAAEQLDVNRLTIRRWINSGKLQSQRIGGVVLIERSEVERLARQKLVGSL